MNDNFIVIERLLKFLVGTSYMVVMMSRIIVIQSTYLKYRNTKGLKVLTLGQAMMNIRSTWDYFAIFPIWLKIPLDDSDNPDLLELSRKRNNQVSIFWVMFSTLMLITLVYSIIDDSN